MTSQTKSSMIMTMKTSTMINNNSISKILPEMRLRQALKNLRAGTIYAHSYDEKLLFEWRSSNPALWVCICDTCGVLGAEKRLKNGKYCCSTRICRIDGKECCFTSVEKVERRKKLQGLIDGVTATKPLTASEKRSISHKRRIDTLSPEELEAEKRRRLDGYQRMKDDPVRKARWKSSLYNRRCVCGDKVHRHVVKTIGGTDVNVYTRGWEHRSVSLLVSIFGDDIFTKFELKNDIFIVDGENADMSTCDIEQLRTGSVEWIEDGVELRHDFDHHMIVPWTSKEEFVKKLSEAFGSDDPCSLLEFWPEDIDVDVNVVIETKGFLRAAMQPQHEDDNGDHWYNRMTANGTNTLDQLPNAVYIIFSWTESSCAMYVVSRNGEMRDGGTLLYVGNGSEHDRNQAIKNHKRGYKYPVDKHAKCPPITVEIGKRVPVPLTSGHIDQRVDKDRLLITLK